MIEISITENEYNENNLLYVQSAMSELFYSAGCGVIVDNVGGRARLKISTPEYYADIIRAEVSDKVAEIIAIKYKYDFFKRNVNVGGLSSVEKEILMTSLIAADLDDDKRYSFERVKCYKNIAVDGVFNFKMVPLKKKWTDVVSYIPRFFLNTQLKEFVTYLLENKTKRVYIDDGRVYDCHYRRLKRSSLLDGDTVKIVREVLLSNCGEVELNGQIPSEDEFYLKEYYKDKIIFSQGVTQKG